MSEENANYVRTEIKVYYQHDIDKLQVENKRLREALVQIVSQLPQPYLTYSETADYKFKTIGTIAEQALGE